MNRDLPPDENTKIVKYLLKENLGEYKVNNKGKKLKTIIIGNNQYRYNPEKPISNRLSKRLEAVKKTNDYKANQIRERVGARTVLKHAIKKKAVITEERSAFRAYANAYTISNIHLKELNGLTYFNYQFDKLNEYLKENRGMKLNATINMKVMNLFDEERNVTVRTRSYTIVNEEDLRNALKRMRPDVETRILDMALYQSGLIISNINNIHIMYNKYNPTRAGKYIELPEWIKKKKACINIKNQDDKCFKYSIECGYCKICDKAHPEKMFHYKKIASDLIFDGVSFPANNNDIDIFEENNKSISINVYEIDDNEQIVISRKLKNKDASCHLDLLRVDEEDCSHYVYIKSLSRLINNQKSNHHAKSYFCKYCNHGFKNDELLNKHYDSGCMEVEGQQIVMPKPYEKVSFKHHFKKLRCPFVVYADFECLTEELKKPDEDEDKNTFSYQEHKPCGFMLNMVNAVDNTNYEFMYRGKDAVDVFCQKLNDIRAEVKEKMGENEKIDMTDEDKEDFKNAKNCFICGDKFRMNYKNAKEEEKYRKVRDHCHFTGKYRGCAHNVCNLNFCNRYFKIPVFFHNMKNYDGHLIIQNADKLSNNNKIGVIAQNSEKFINISFESLSVKDTFGFLTASLDKLVSMSKYDNTDEEDKSKWLLREDWKDNFRFSSKNDLIKSEKCLDLLTDKGVYPYDYMNSFDKFDDEQLPSKDDFYSQLSEEGISVDDYERAKIIWKHFDIKNMGEYHDLYLKTDVLLLTDIFENFRDVCMKYYGLDPAYYYTLPNFAFDAMLKMTGVEIDLIYDQEMYEMIEAGLRGGMCMVSTKKVEANNKYMGEEYDKNKESSYINYFDANNLYGLSMIQKLPYKNLKWDDTLKEEDIINYKNNNIGYILEVDLEYPKELHDLHNDYPMAPEVMNVKADMLSDKQIEIYEFLNHKKPTDEKTNKLILNLNDKEKYVIHIRTLQFYLKQGLKLKKIHRAIKFEQKEVLKPYIEFNTEKRKNARNDFEKDVYKLMNNAIFGKTMEDKRKHLDFEVVSDETRYMKCVSNPNIKHSHIINENLVGVEKQKTKLKLDKPIFIGMSILDLSKQHMYKFYYDVMKPKYGDNIKMVYTDTDSFVFHTKTNDIYEDLNAIKKELDFSDYPKEHKCYDDNNKKVLGKFKDELKSKIITGFIALRPKCYAYSVYGDEKEYKKCKGIAKGTVRRQMKYEEFETVLKTNEVIHKSFNSIRSKNHRIFSITTKKNALSSYENKKYWIDSVNSLAYGHYKINSLKTT